MLALYCSLAVRSQWYLKVSGVAGAGMRKPRSPVLLKFYPRVLEWDPVWQGLRVCGKHIL